MLLLLILTLFLKFAIVRVSGISLCSSRVLSCSDGICWILMEINIRTDTRRINEETPRAYFALSLDIFQYFRYSAIPLVSNARYLYSLLGEIPSGPLVVQKLSILATGTNLKYIFSTVYFSLSLFLIVYQTLLPAVILFPLFSVDVKMLVIVVIPWGMERVRKNIFPLESCEGERKIRS